MLLGTQCAPCVVSCDEYISPTSSSVECCVLCMFAFGAVKFDNHSSQNTIE